MYNVSEQFKSEMNNPVRNPVTLRVKFELTNPNATSSSSIGTPSQEAYSEVSEIKLDDIVAVRYDTLEHNFTILDGAGRELQPIVFDKYQGYVSTQFSDQNCVLNVQPSIVVNYPQTYALAGLSIKFDEVNEEYCSYLRATAYNGVDIVFDSYFTNDSNYFITESAIPFHDKLEIRFINTALPYRRVRVQYLSFGLTKYFVGDTLTSAEDVNKIDPISASLPVHDFSFSFIDMKNEYNPENPSGLYAFIEELQPIKFDYGYELSDGIVEWVEGGSLYTTGEVNFSSNGSIPNVTIKAGNVLKYMDDNFYEGLYRPVGISLYDLAVDLLERYNVSYELDNSLKSIYTKTPLPIDSVKNCLQLIANAGRCTLNVDRFGVVRMLRNFAVEALKDSLESQLFDSTDDLIYCVTEIGQNSFSFNKDNYYNIPTINKIPPLKNLISEYALHTIETSVSEINKTNIVATSPTQFILNHEMAVETALTLTGTLAISSPVKYYTNCCIVTLTGVGEAIVNGKLINTSKATISKSYAQNGLDCNVVNPLICTYEDAIEYIEWVGAYITLRNQYKFDNRGFYELDVMDRIYIDTLYTENQTSILTENTILFNGAISGKTTVVIGE